MKKPTKRKCAVRGCQNKFYPRNSFHVACSVSCAMAISDQKRAKKTKANKIKSKSKLSHSRSWYISRCQSAINAYVRARDYGLPCICCGKDMSENKYGGTIDASHYRSRGSSPHLRFCLNNIFAGCVRCNRWLSGSITDMRLGMITRVGLEKVELIESDNKDRKYTIEYLDRMTKIFRKKTRILNKRRG